MLEKDPKGVERPGAEEKLQMEMEGGNVFGRIRSNLQLRPPLPLIDDASKTGRELPCLRVGKTCS